MKLSKKELAMLHFTLRDLIDDRDSEKLGLPEVVGVWVGNDDGTDDHHERVTEEEWQDLDDKMFSMINTAWMGEIK